MAMEDRQDLAREVASVPWYHTIELPGGFVTPGRWDTRHALKRLPFPSSLAGKRCLDVGTWDGFWAFEMERRGASEVVAIDLDDASQWDWPALHSQSMTQRWQARVAKYRAFWVAHRALGSRVQRLEQSVYNLSPESVGRFDFVFMGSILIHLRDPAGALMAVRRVVKGELLAADQISLILTLTRRTPAADLTAVNDPLWWTPNRAALVRLVRAAGFEITAAGGPYFLRPGPGARRPSLWQSLSSRTQLMNRVGTPHAWVTARPAGEQPLSRASSSADAVGHPRTS
ncbi:MAG: class I SAM-dependent methyltransferase [bacterium]